MNIHFYLHFIVYCEMILKWQQTIHQHHIISELPVNMACNDKSVIKIRVKSLCLIKYHSMKMYPLLN
jgi:hypothetical protein